MIQKFVIRLLTEEGELLAWCEEHLKPEPNRAEGNCRFRVSSSIFRVVKAGSATFISIHWCDLDVARKMRTFGGAFEIPASHVGGTARMDWMQAVWGIAGNTSVPLPPVTVGTVSVSPAPAALGAAG